jgi:hypothetical protein
MRSLLNGMPMFTGACLGVVIADALVLVLQATPMHDMATAPILLSFLNCVAVASLAAWCLAR